MGKIYKQMSIEERTLIQTQLSMGFKPVQIARELGRSAGTLSRELKRNRWVRQKLPRGVADLRLQVVIVPMWRNGVPRLVRSSRTRCARCDLVQCSGIRSHIICKRVTRWSRLLAHCPQRIPYPDSTSFP